MSVAMAMMMDVVFLCPVIIFTCLAFLLEDPDANSKVTPPLDGKLRRHGGSAEGGPNEEASNHCHQCQRRKLDSRDR